jgi:hypothetical protein
MESSPGPCPDRRRRNRLGVAGRCGCTGEGVASPGEHARGREGVAHASLVEETEREWELEVGCLGGCQSKGEERGIGCTRGASRWGHRGGGVRIPAWRVVER